MGKQRIYEFDVIRTFAAYAVIVVHITALALSAGVPPSPALFFCTAVNRFLKFTTPVFIYLAGLMIAIKYKDNTIPVGPFYFDRLKRVLLPYAIFSVLYYGMHILLDHLGWSPFQLLFFLISGSAEYHLYFVIIVTQLYLAAPLLIKLKNTGYQGTILVVAGIITVMAALRLTHPYSDRNALKFLFPFMVGLLYGQDIYGFLMKPSIKWLLLTMTALAGGAYTWIFYGAINGLAVFSADIQALAWLVYTNIAVFALIVLAAWVVKHQWLRQFSLRVTGFSYYIYLIHPMLITCIGLGLDYFGILALSLRLPILLISVLVLSTILAAGTKNILTRLVR